MKKTLFYMVLILLIGSYAYGFMPICIDDTYISNELETIFPGAEMPIYVCQHDVDGDGVHDIIVAFCYNEQNETMNIIQVFMPHEYYDILDMPPDYYDSLSNIRR